MVATFCHVKYIESLYIQGRCEYILQSITHYEKYIDRIIPTKKTFLSI